MRGAIDKVDGFFYEGVNIEQIKKRAKAVGLKSEFKRIGSDRTWALQIGDDPGECVFLELRFQKSTYSKKLISNPSRFRTHRRYLSFLTELFGRNQTENIRIIRIDFCVDLDLPFAQLIQWLRVPYKRIKRSDTDKGRNRTGITFGRGDLVVCVYDKSEEQRRSGIELGRSVTRVEVRLAGDKLPVQYLRELPGVLTVTVNGRRLRPFSVLSIEPSHLAPLERFATPPLLNSKAIDKLVNWVRLETYLKIGGLDLAKKQMDAHGNFRRNVRGLVTFEEYPHDLDEILISDLEAYFERSRSARTYDEL